MTKKNPYKVLSKGALASVLAASAILPIAATTTFAATTQEISNIVVEKDGVQYSFTLATYKEALVEGFLTGNDVAFVYTSNNKYYSVDVYKEALVESNGDLSEALVLLDDTDLAKTITPFKGQFDENGEFILIIESVKAITATTLSVTFEGSDEAVEVTVDALTHGQTEVTFVYAEVTYEATLDTPYVDQAVIDAEALAAAIEAAEAAIAELPEVITLADKQDVEDAAILVSAAYELDADAEIAGIDILEAAQATIAQLEAGEEAAAQLAVAVTAAQDAITALPTVEELTLENAEVVAAARELVTQVTDLGGVDTDVENLATLEALEDQIEVLQAQAEVDAAVAVAQEAVDSLTLASATNVDSQVKVDAAKALVQPAKDAIAAVIALDTEYDVTAFNNAVVTAEDNIAKAEAVQAAKTLVSTAKETLLDADYDAAKEAVDALPNSDAKTLENAKLIELQAERTAILKAVNDATNDVVLYEALNVKPFAVDVNLDFITDYNADLGTDALVSKATITEVQDAIKAVNADKAASALSDIVDAANDATTDLTDLGFVTTPGEADADALTKTQGDFEALVTAANTAIATLPVDYKASEEDEQTLAATLQAQVDKLVTSNKEYVSRVAPVLTANGDIAFKNALVAAGVLRIDNNNIADYKAAVVGSKSVADLQYAIDVENADLYIGNGSTLVTQEKIDKAQSLVDVLPADVEGNTTKSELQALVTNAQEDLNVGNEAAAKLAEATAAVAALTNEAGDALAEGVDQAAIVAAAELVDALPGTTEEESAEDYSEAKAALEAEIAAAQVLQDAVNLSKATAAVAALTNATGDALAEGVDQAAIVAAAELVDALPGTTEDESAEDYSEAKAALEAELAGVQVLQDVVNLEEATAAVAALTNATGDALAEGVNQEAIDAAKTLVTALPSESQDGLQADITAAQELLDVKNINEAIAANDVTALQEIIVGLNNVDFSSLSSAQRSELGAYIILQATTAFSGTTTFDEAVSIYVGTYTTNIAEFNTKANVVIASDASTADITKAKNDVITAITELTGTEYLAGLTAVQKLDLAEDILDAKPADGYKVKTIAQLQGIVEANK